jgi:hypothetical protein
VDSIRKEKLMADKHFDKPKWAEDMPEVVEREAQRILNNWQRSYFSALRSAMEESDTFVEALTHLLSGAQAMLGGVRDLLVGLDETDLVQASDAVSRGSMEMGTMQEYLASRPDFTRADATTALKDKRVRALMAEIMKGEGYGDVTADNLEVVVQSRGESIEDVMERAIAAVKNKDIGPEQAGKEITEALNESMDLFNGFGKGDKDN